MTPNTPRKRRLSPLVAVLALIASPYSASADERPAEPALFFAQHQGPGLIPLPEPFKEPQTGEQPDNAPEGDVLAPPGGGSADAPAEIRYDFEALPPEVKRMRELLMETARSGDIEKLRPLIGLGDSQTLLSLATLDGDPIDHLRSISGDGEGEEILAILLEVLEAGYVRVDAGQPSELYIWPYFFAVPLDSLTKVQKVELFKLVTAGDYEEMRNFGAYIFYRVGIAPDGTWVYFVSGD
mgnify:CR=1 FL=1